MIPKQGKDWSKPELCKPLSLVNVDCKIFVKCMGHKIKFIYRGIYMTRSDRIFLKKKYRKNSIRKVMNIIELGQNRREPAVFCFLNAAQELI